MEENQEVVTDTAKKGIRPWVLIVSIIATMILTVGVTVGLVVSQLPKILNNQAQPQHLSKQELFQI